MSKKPATRPSKGIGFDTLDVTPTESEQPDPPSAPEPEPEPAAPEPAAPEPLNLSYEPITGHR